jgi:hypothetical protein
MKRIVILGILICLTVSGYGQRKIKKVEVKENGFNVTLKYNPLISEITHEGLQIKITPITPDDLNSEFLIENTYNGKFKYSHYENSRVSYFLKKNKRNREKTDLEFLQEGAEWLLDNEKIDQEEYVKLTKQLIIYYDEEAGKELYNIESITSCNPYSIGEKYLSVFRIEISNPTKTYLTFKGDIILESGNQIQKPLSEDEITQFLFNNKLLLNNKIESLKRHNLTYPLSIPPNSKFQKYFAVFPIDYNNNVLLLSISENEVKLKWDITKTEEIINEKYTFYEFNIGYVSTDNYSNTEGINFSILQNPESIIFLDNNSLFIDEKHTSNKFEIFNLSLYGDKLYYGRKSFTGSELLDVDKNRRKELSVPITKIDELKKKVKF